jgi:hypothetical protein
MISLSTLDNKPLRQSVHDPLARNFALLEFIQALWYGLKSTFLVVDIMDSQFATIEQLGDYLVPCAYFIRPTCSYI